MKASGSHKRLVVAKRKLPLFVVLADVVGLVSSVDVYNQRAGDVICVGKVRKSGPGVDIAQR